MWYKKVTAFNAFITAFVSAWISVGCSSRLAPASPTLTPLPAVPALATLVPSVQLTTTPLLPIATPAQGFSKEQSSIDSLSASSTKILTATISLAEETAEPPLLDSAAAAISDHNFPADKNTASNPTLPVETSESAVIEDKPQLISGTVLSGGDTTDPDRQGGPRRFEFKVQTDDGEIVFVAYTALPPGPAADNAPEIRLDFYAGSVLPGDYLIAYGTYETAANSLIVASTGDYIETFPQKP